MSKGSTNIEELINGMYPDDLNELKAHLEIIARIDKFANKIDLNEDTLSKVGVLTIKGTHLNLANDIIRRYLS